MSSVALLRLSFETLPLSELPAVLTEFVQVVSAVHRPLAQSSADFVLLELPPQPATRSAALDDERHEQDSRHGQGSPLHGESSVTAGSGKEHHPVGTMFETDASTSVIRPVPKTPETIPPLSGRRRASIWTLIVLAALLGVLSILLVGSTGN